MSAKRAREGPKEVAIEVTPERCDDQGSDLSSLHSNLCRICFTGKSKGELIAPCQCKGSVGLVHRFCLERWLEVKATNACEICNTKLPVVRVQKTFWDFVREKSRNNHKYFLPDLICVLLITPLTAYSIFLSIQSAISYSESNWDCAALITLVILLSSSYSLWICMCFDHHYSYFRQWRLMNYKTIYIKPVEPAESAKRESVASPKRADENANSQNQNAPTPPNAELPAPANANDLQMSPSGSEDQAPNSSEEPEEKRARILSPPRMPSSAQ